MDSGKIELSAAIKNLREQLQDAMDEGRDKKLRFEIQDLVLEMRCVVSRDVEAKGGIKFWLIDAGVDGSVGDVKTQVVKLKLRPSNGDGKPLLLNDEEKMRR